ncbi:unnamed protein product [Pleuronectes platessa]|uniref:Uncharacterized protein n=1 Tax=Pleuronectes platessa TaxID=8262 RepID=A0A9N7UAV8_PLEPL|nr:unnamed protein product [Pleuronectes platessa]
MSANQQCAANGASLLPPTTPHTLVAVVIVEGGLEGGGAREEACETARGRERERGRLKNGKKEQRGAVLPDIGGLSSMGTERKEEQHSSSSDLQGIWIWRAHAGSQGCSHMSRLSHLAEGEDNLGPGVGEWQPTIQKGMKGVEMTAAALGSPRLR